jgi:hypothetical protein
VSEFFDIHGEFENVRTRMLHSIEVVRSITCSAVRFLYVTVAETGFLFLEE